MIKLHLNSTRAAKYSYHNQYHLEADWWKRCSSKSEN